MEKVLHYLASALGLALTAGVVVIAVGEGAPNPLTQPVPVQIEFAALGVILAGTLVALKWARVGGAMMIAGTLVFESVEWAVNHRTFPFVLVFAAVGLLHMIAGALNGPRSHWGTDRAR